MAAYAYNVNAGVSFRYLRGDDGSHELWVQADWESPITFTLHGVGKRIYSAPAENELQFYKGTKPIMEDIKTLKATLAELMVDTISYELQEKGIDILKIEKAKFEERITTQYNWTLYIDLEREHQTGEV